MRSQNLDVIQLVIKMAFKGSVEQFFTVLLGAYCRPAHWKQSFEFRNLLIYLISQVGEKFLIAFFTKYMKEFAKLAEDVGDKLYSQADFSKGELWRFACGYWDIICWKGYEELFILLWNTLLQKKLKEKDQLARALLNYQGAIKYHQKDNYNKSQIVMSLYMRGANPICTIIEENLLNLWCFLCEQGNEAMDQLSNFQFLYYQ